MVEGGHHLRKAPNPTHTIGCSLCSKTREMKRPVCLEDAGMFRRGLYI